MTQLKFKDLCLSLNQRPIWQQLNLSLPDKQWLAILGPSGVGKTQLLRTLSGLPLPRDAQFSGEISLADTVLTPLQRRQQVMLLWQSQVTLPWLNCLDNVLIGYHLRQQVNTSVKQAARNLLEQVGLAQAEKLFPAALSGGMRQRIGIARVLLEDRPVLCLDEPFSALDVVTKRHLYQLMRRLCKGKTVVLITHDPDEAVLLADKIVVLNGQPAQFTAEFEVTESQRESVSQRAAIVESCIHALEPKHHA